MVFVQWVHYRPKRVWVKSFANRTMRVAETVVQMEDGKPVGIRGMGFSLIRFNGAGQPDMKRFWKEVYASLPDLLDPDPGKVHEEGNIVHMEQAFVGNGGRWSPIVDEKVLLEKAALGLIRPPELDRGWRCLGDPAISWARTRSYNAN